MSILAAMKPDFAQAQEALSAQVREGGPFVLKGGGTSRIGMAVGEALAAPAGAMEYEASALTLTVAAGTRLDEIDAALAVENQRLAFEPPRMAALLGRSGGATIGGAVAGNLSGPRRVGMGACRDFCLGMAFVDGRGQVVKNGGRVMKNVTGYDLVKLMAGSQGTLGLITEVTLKVQPIPEVAATLVLSGLGEARAVDAMSAALGTPFDVTGAAHLGGDQPRTLIRLEGFETAVRYRMGELQRVLSDFGESVVEWDAQVNAETWAEIRDVAPFHEADGDVWRVNIKPSDAPVFVAGVAPRDVIYDWGGNRVWLLTEAGADVRTALNGGHATLVRASEETKRRLSVFQPENAVISRLSAGLRQKFDPEGKFNRGMMG